MIIDQKAQNYKHSNNQPLIEVVDLFCGIGGLSYGLKSAGCKILAGYDLDKTCEYAYQSNTGGKFNYRNIKDIDPVEVTSLYSQYSYKILAGCAPCQPFSSYAFKHKNKDSSKYDLLYEFARIIEGVGPEIIVMENVPAIASFKLKPVLNDFVSKLKEYGYHVWVQSVYCPDYGIPQTRKR